MTLKRAYGPYTLLGMEQDMLCSPNLMLHIVLEAAGGLLGGV